jgi:hypothetical protein
METIEVTTTAQEHPCPAGTKVVVLTDNSSHVTYVDFEADAKFPDPEADPPVETTSMRMNTGKNVYQLPEGKDSVSVIGDGVYTIGMDCLRSRGEASDPAVQAQLDDHEARISALEGGTVVPSATGTKKKEDHPPAKHNTDHYSSKKK